MSEVILETRKNTVSVLFVAVTYLGYLCCYEAKPPASLAQFKIFHLVVFLIFK